MKHFDFVICDKVDTCQESESCDHGVPHAIQDWNDRDGKVKFCTELDDCEENKVRCVRVYDKLDFEIEELFIL